MDCIGSANELISASGYDDGGGGATIVATRESGPSDLSIRWRLSAKDHMDGIIGELVQHCLHIGAFSRV